MPKFVTYRRVSTKDQGRSGLGLEAQAEAIGHYVTAQGGSVVPGGDFVEVESGKGSNALELRPVLNQAIELARTQKATLLVARLDRLSRNVHFISGVMERKIDFRSVDHPSADKTMLHIYATMAEAERDRIASNIKKALAAKKAGGGTLGNAGSLKPFNDVRATQAATFAKKLKKTLRGFKAAKMSQRAMVDALNESGVTTPQGGRWSLVQVQRTLSRVTSQYWSGA